MVCCPPDDFVLGLDSLLSKVPPLPSQPPPYLSCGKIGNGGGWKVYNRGEEMSILTPLSVLTDAATTFDQPLCFV